MERIARIAQQGNVVALKPRHLAVAGALSIMAFESVATLRGLRRRDSKVHPIDYAHDGDQSIYILPGCRGDGKFIADALEDTLGELGNLHGVKYPERGFSLDDIKRQLLETRATERDKRASFYAMSMGGMVLAHLLRDDEFRENFGPIDTIVLDSSPSSVEDLQRGTYRALTAAARIPSTYTLSKVYERFAVKSANKMGGETPEADLSRRRKLATASTPLGEIAAQTRFMIRSHFGDDELSHVEVGRIEYLSATDDEVVKLKQAHGSWQRIFGRMIGRAYDVSRDNPSHAEGVEHPDKVRELLRTRVSVDDGDGLIAA